MQHQLIDIFVFDNIGDRQQPIYESSWENDQKMFIMQEDGSALEETLPGEDTRLPSRRISIPLFSMIEPWKLSHRAPAGFQRKMERFVSGCLENIPRQRIGNISNIGYIGKVETDGHLVCSLDMRDKREELEKLCYDRRIVYIQGLPSNTIMVCPAPEYTGVLAVKTNEVVGMPLNRLIGSFIVPYSIRHYGLGY